MKAEVSIPVGLATCTLVYGIYQLSTPVLADVRMVSPGGGEGEALASSEKTALIAAATGAAAVSLISKDPVPFVLGGLFAVALSWAQRHARAVDPGTGRLLGAHSASETVVAGQVNA